MKLLLMTLLLSSCFANGPKVKQLNAKPPYGDPFFIQSHSYDGKMLSVLVSYSGGCKKHEFESKLEKCTEGFPPNCEVYLHHNANGDTCEAGISKTLLFSTKDLGFKDHLLGFKLTPNYKGAKSLDVVKK